MAMVKSNAGRNLIDALIKTILIRLGRTVDVITGRNWKPSSSLAANELIEKIKKLMDYEAERGDIRGFVPHYIRIKVQWDKFREAKSLSRLKNELLVAIVDYINDNLYHTYAPLDLEIEADYFVEGVVLKAGFGAFKSAEVEMKIPIDVDVSEKKSSVEEKKEEEEYLLSYEFEIDGEKVSDSFEVREGEVLGVGRAESNRLVVPHGSVSRFHASLKIKQGELLISDLGSTNGTFLGAQKLEVGKVYSLKESVKLGVIDIRFRLFSNNCNCPNKT